MKDEQRVDALLRMQASARDRLKVRQQGEWRMNFSMWAALLGIAAALSSTDYDVSGPGACAVGITALVIFAGYLFWSMSVTKHHENDRWFARDFGIQAEKLVGSTAPLPSRAQHPDQPRDVCLDWGTGMGVLVTFALVALVVVAAFCRSSSS